MLELSEPSQYLYIVLANFRLARKVHGIPILLPRQAKR
jgi:hypothetical protein